MRYPYYFPYRRARRANLIAQRNKQDRTPLIPSPPKPPKSEIKKQLKIIVNLSNTLQDENNKLQDMKDAWVPFKEIFSQRLLIGKLCSEQYQAMKRLKYVESFYPGKIHNRFFYFKDKPIYFP